MENNIFKLIDFTLKKKKIDDSNLETKIFYLLNRWLSMCDANICLIINSIDILVNPKCITNYKIS